MFKRIQQLFNKIGIPLRRFGSREAGGASGARRATSTTPRYVLVLSGGGTRGFYTLGVLKALEEAGLREQIDAIYGISVGAIIASYRASGRKAQDLFESFKDLNISPTNWLNLLPTKNFLKTKVLQERFKRDLPQTFEALKIPTYIGATDMNTAELIIFHEGKLLEPLLGSMALPGVFPSIKYQSYLLNDGGIIDNFPTTLAQQHYPNHKIIGVALNKFKEDKNPKNLIQTLITAYAIVMRKDLVQRSREIEISFYETIECGILELDRKKRTKAFDQGYLSGKKIFGK
ncbi:MAG: patatin-like phospholipase family protein [Candidatus Peribacteria bacterium]|jgi:NTE family protein|nr:patatin-like phospholipase family protein [Candidatus Peribacteria bacterium]